MKPKVTLHNSVSLDGAFTGFAIDMELHYRIVSSFKADVYMFGSETARTGLALFGQGTVDELPADFVKPHRDSSHSYWVVPDSKGSLKGLLHHYRRFEFCREVIVLVSKTTPMDYLDYLKQRNYDHLVSGETFVDHELAIQQLSEKYAVRAILVDTGSTLGNILLNHGLVDEISLLISPLITGNASRKLFEGVSSEVDLKCIRCERLEGYVWVCYAVGKSRKSRMTFSISKTNHFRSC